MAQAHAITRNVRIGLAILTTLCVGVAVGAGSFPGTVTHTSTVYATTATGLPAGCVQAIALTRSLENAVGQQQVVQLKAQFEAAAAGCEIPAACKQAPAFFRRIATVHSRAELLDLTHGFWAAVADCRSN